MAAHHGPSYAMTITIFGIRDGDTIKKARAWLSELPPFAREPQRTSGSPRNRSRVRQSRCTVSSGILPSLDGELGMYAARDTVITKGSPGAFAWRTS